MHIVFVENNINIKDYKEQFELNFGNYYIIPISVEIVNN